MSGHGSTGRPVRAAAAAADEARRQTDANNAALDRHIARHMPAGDPRVTKDGKPRAEYYGKK
jgi:hypothetical protein